MIHITQKAPSKYAIANWYGAVGGAALGTDPDPNVTPPATNRILQVSAKRGALMLMGNCSLRIVQIGGVNVGTNISVVAWLYDGTQAKWIQIGQQLNLTGANNLGNPGGLSYGNIAGAKFFFQIVANPGTTPLLGFDHN